MTSAYFCDDDIALWRQFVAPVLGDRAAQQFIKATKRADDLFATRFIRPQLFQPMAPNGGSYIPVDVTTHTPGRNHLLAESFADPDRFQHLDADPFLGLSYFTNPLRIGEQKIDPLTGELEWERPSERVILGDLHAFTFEFDVPDAAFLKRQLSWLRSQKNPLDSRVGSLYRHLSQYADFAGITAVYSGSKSLHFHLIFDTLLAASGLGLDKVLNVRRGLMAHWDFLHADVLRHLEVPAEITADTSLRAPEAYRRFPNGNRTIDKDGHILGIPKGTMVPQVTLWERWTDRAADGADTLFFRPEPFVEAPKYPAHIRHAPRFDDKAGTFPLRRALSQEELDHCERKLRAFFPADPKFEHLRFEAGKWVARFTNSATDRNPSSVMTGGYNRIHLQGRDAAGLNPRTLPYSLDIMIRGWVAELHRPDVPEWDDCEWTVETTRPTPPDSQEVAFSEAATDRDAASRQIRRFLRRTVMSNECSLICAPEGIKKTSSLFADHHRLQAEIELRTGSKLSMYAFSDYRSAAEKCEAFNDAQKMRPGSRPLYHGVVLPSFSKAYSEACQSLGLGEITTEIAAGAGYENLWSAVATIQPVVMDELKERHRRMWAEIGCRKAVFFSVHDVAQRWTLTTPTRLMWAPDFWIGRMDDPEWKRSCRRATALGLLVHDEVGFESLVALHRAEVVDWVLRLKAADPKVWQGRRGNLASQWASYDRFTNANPFPVVGDAVCEIAFHDVREIVGLGSASWEEVETRWSGEYTPLANEESKDIYAAHMGRRWLVASREWWKGAAQRVVVLTTEAVPTEVARRISTGWTVHELDTPHLERDFVDVFPQKGVTGRNLLNAVAKYRGTTGRSKRVVISNKVKALPDTVTHMGARGSNAYIGQDLAQTMTFLTPGEVERLEALNAWTGRSDMIRLRHWDQFNQSAGRNLGFRKSGDVRHDLLISHRLLETLLNCGLGRSRYDLRLHISRAARYRVRIKAA